jgi:hypothetical protein
VVGMKAHLSIHFPSGLRTTSITLASESRTMAVCRQLIIFSQWFSVLPLPDDLWEITVKEENEARLRAWCEDHSATSS